MQLLLVVEEAVAHFKLALTQHLLVAVVQVELLLDGVFPLQVPQLVLVEMG
jgi:hypothetical protein